MIVRGPRPKQDFTLISNAVLRDERLSYRARGILADLLSRPNDWRTDFKSLARAGREGESAIRTALVELRAAGYIVQTKTRGERGRWITTNTVYDTPQDVGEEEPQVAPGVGFPGVARPQSGNPTPIRTTVTNDVEVGSPEGEHGSRGDHGLPSGATLRAADPEPPKIRPIRKRRKLTSKQRQQAWNDFLAMDLGDFAYDRELRAAAFIELETHHGAINPAEFAQAMIDRCQWDGFVASFALGENVTLKWGEGA